MRGPKWINFLREVVVFAGVGVAVGFVGSICILGIGGIDIVRIGIGVVGGIGVIGMGIVGIHGDGDGAASQIA